MTERENNNENNKQIWGLEGGSVATTFLNCSPLSAWTGVAKWYVEHIHEMTPQILMRHIEDLQGQFKNHELGLTPLSDSSRMEIAEAIKVIEARLDEILPKIPAAIDEHDKNNGNRVHLNWPDYATSASRYIHLHFCELIDSWRIHVRRQSTALIAIDPVAEQRGQSGFAFDNEQDMCDFVDNYQLSHFVVGEPREFRAATEYATTKTSYYLTLSNKFTPQQANTFLDVYKSAINNLAIIADARRRAMNVDGGHVGFMTVDHFAPREQMELIRISAARFTLGLGEQAERAK